MSAYIVARDRQGLIPTSTKVLGVVAATFALLGTCLCGNLKCLRRMSMFNLMLSFAATVFSSEQAAICFQV